MRYDILRLSVKRDLALEEVIALLAKHIAANSKVLL